MEVSEAKRLKALEEETARSKNLLAEQMLDAAALRELLAKKWQGLPLSVSIGVVTGPHIGLQKEPLLLVASGQRA